MEQVAIAALEPDTAVPSERRSLTPGLDASNVSVNHYRLGPGERLAGLHAHEHQEEVFVVLEGRVAFETLDGVVTVDAGEAVRFAPGEHKSGTNQTDEPAIVLAIGAPRDGGDLFVPLDCRDCGHPELRLEFDETGEALRCPACGGERQPNCPECGGANLLAVRDEEGDRVVSACRDCGTRFE